MHDYQGSLEERLAQLESEVAGQNNLILVGSSFGGLMAACFAINHPHRVRRLVLLAPALNFGGYHPPDTPLSVPTLLVMGQFDTVCPPDLVLPQASATFNALTVRIEDDDHMLHRTFPTLDWPHLLT
jgi:pimeloyl-ACP methyl ester carboxylesterase